MNEELEMSCFQIISNVGEAHACFSEAMALAREGKFEEAEEAITRGDTFFVEAHKHHHDMLTRQINGEKIEFHMLITHAQDQLLCTETLKEMAKEIIFLHRQLAEVKNADK